MGEVTSPGIWLAGNFCSLIGKSGRACRAVEKKKKPLLAGLGYRVNAGTVALDRNQGGRGREIAVPDVVVDTLKVPDSSAGACIDGYQCIGKKIVADPVSSVKVKVTVSRLGQYDAPLVVERHARPIVGRAGAVHASFGQVSYPYSPGRGMV